MPRNPALRFLHTAPPAAGVTDADLARRYAAARDEAAFELLVRRHADLVWAACRRVLGADAQAAEDAFQATFLALARKAGSIRAPSAAGWLHRVAVRAALRRRPKVPVLSPADREGAAGPDPDRGEAAAVVHQEVDRLATKYRLPVLLCDLEGLTHAAAAARLGWPVGTVSGRLSVARGLLRDRLVRRGLAGASAAALATLVPEPAPAMAVRAAIALTTGGPIPTAVVSLTEGVLSAMRWAKIKMFTAVFAATAAVAGATAVGVSQDRPGTGAVPVPAKPGAPAGPQPDPAWNGAVPPTAFPDLTPGRPHPAIAPVTVLTTDSSLRKLQKARLNLLVQEFQLAAERVRVGNQPASELRAYYSQLAAAAADVFDAPADLRPWLEAWVGGAKADEAAAEMRHKIGTSSVLELTAARRTRVEAEIALAKLNERAAGPRG
jgi:RNA polymerase sigma factor (sigma-70 family)